MESFYRFETVNFNLEIKDKDDPEARLLDDCKNVVITLTQDSKCKKRQLKKDIESPDVGLDPDDNIINLYLSQEETGSFDVGALVIQVNVLYENTERDVTSKGQIAVLDNDYAEVMS